ncbi:hypothetical protein BD289DRAFT_7406 [Coniella lustricola]|uniref:Secreted protein n=1 Tax=Coniella lustricola TaxID=2025994 RepID=A0A2T3AJW6_9PEZI|nr:hypothetical protein BD289DRAFT_7406 [Coniella lustricola]
MNAVAWKWLFWSFVSCSPTLCARHLDSGQIRIRCHLCKTCFWCSGKSRINSTPLSVIQSRFMPSLNARATQLDVCPSRWAILLRTQSCMRPRIVQRSNNVSQANTDAREENTGEKGSAVRWLGIMRR